jgi:hypothetical protein
MRRRSDGNVDGHAAESTNRKPASRTAKSKLMSHREVRGREITKRTIVNAYFAVK